MRNIYPYSIFDSDSDSLLFTVNCRPAVLVTRTYKYNYKAPFCMSGGSVSVTHAETAECKKKTILSWFFHSMCLISPIHNRSRLGLCKTF